MIRAYAWKKTERRSVFFHAYDHSVKIFLRERISGAETRHINNVTDSVRCRRTWDGDNDCLKGDTATAQTEVSERLPTMRKAVKRKLSDYICGYFPQSRSTIYVAERLFVCAPAIAAKSLANSRGLWYYIGNDRRVRLYGFVRRLRFFRFRQHIARRFPPA